MIHRRSRRHLGTEFMISINSATATRSRVFVPFHLPFFHHSLEVMPRTLPFDKLPAWMKKDSRIQTGYREELKTVAKCFWSLFYLHNEFVNVWSHLLPAIVYAIILVKEARFALVDNYDSKISSELNAVRFYVGTSFLLMIFSVCILHQHRALSLLTGTRVPTISLAAIPSVWLRGC